MISSNAVSAPQLNKGAFVYAAWSDKTGGTKEDFYKFLTTPSNERDEFLAGYDFEMSLSDRSLILTVKGLSATVSPVDPVKPGFGKIELT